MIGLSRLTKRKGPTVKKITITLPESADMCDAATLIGVLSEGAAAAEQADFIARMGVMEIRADVDGDIFVSTL